MIFQIHDMSSHYTNDFKFVVIKLVKRYQADALLASEITLVRLIADVLDARTKVLLAQTRKIVVINVLIIGNISVWRHNLNLRIHKYILRFKQFCMVIKLLHCFNFYNHSLSPIFFFYNEFVIGFPSSVALNFFQ